MEANSFGRPGGAFTGGGGESQEQSNSEGPNGEVVKAIQPEMEESMQEDPSTVVAEGPKA